jgi:hypothetical protein
MSRAIIEGRSGGQTDASEVIEEETAAVPVETAEKPPVEGEAPVVEADAGPKTELDIKEDYRKKYEDLDQNLDEKDKW